MREDNELTIAKLAEMFTNELIVELDSPIESTYANSKIALAILRKGKETIPEIGKYLNEVLAKFVEKYEEDGKENTIKQGWILLYVDIAFNGEKPSTLNNFDELKEISKNYVPA